MNDLQTQHKVLLEIAKTFHELCLKHHIPYYMLGGTMLGAVRHKGFIPWDDDMDFGIPRPYFKQFVETARQELPNYYKLLYYDNSDYAILGFAKISDNRTSVTETYTFKTTEQIGVNIDLFPLDNANEKKGVWSYNNYIRKLFKLQKLLCINADDRPLPKRLLARTIQTLVPISAKKIPACFDKVLARKSDKLPMYVNYFGAWGLKELVSKKVMGTPVLYPFEDMQLYGVEDYDAYLKSLYGDYMVIPPEKQRHTHLS